MKSVKKLITVILSMNLIFSQSVCINAKEVSNKEVHIGDKYDKKIVTVEDKDVALDDMKSEMFVAPKFFTSISSDIESENTIKTEQLLIPKTDSEYEIALAYDDGDYTFVGTADTYEEAVKKADIENEKIRNVTTQFVVPVVLDTDQGTINYATYGIGRCIKIYKEGTVDKSYRVCNIFKDKDLKCLDRNINDNYCSEMPLLEQGENSAKIYINGCSGWMNTNKYMESGNENGCLSSDVSIQPVNQVTNPSFYYAGNDGLLYHYISTSMVGSEVQVGSDAAKKIGKAPSYLEKGVKYLSYDGQHFYTTKNRGIPKTLYILTEDLKAGNFNNSVNHDNPYYNYYLYLPFRSRTNYTAEDLDRYIDYYIEATGSTNSKLKGIGKSLIENQNKYGVNALLALGIAINESNGGMSPLAQSTNNIFSLNATDYNTDNNAEKFDTVEDCIEVFCKTYMSKWFTDVNNTSFYGDFLGNKGFGANAKYASDPYWADKAANNVCKIENYLSNRNVSNYKDYDYYQLFRYSKASTVKNIDNECEYKVNENFVSCSGEFVGATGILLCNDTLSLNGVECNEIALDRTLQSNGKNDGTYNWSNKGYIDKDAIELLNQGKTNVSKSDVNKDGEIDGKDLAKVASLYNNSSYDLDYMCDLNNDGVIDIYDIVKISSRL